MPGLSFDDLIDTEGLVRHLQEAAESADNAGRSVRNFESSVEDVEGDLPPATNAVRDYSSAIRQMSNVLDDINNRMAMSNTIAIQMRDSIQKLTATTRQGRQGIADTKRDVETLAAAYKSMGIEATSVKGILDHLIKREKDYDKVIALSTAYVNDRVHTNEELQQTYNSLSAQYSAIKLLINEMTVEERESSDAGKALVSTSEQIMSKMNELQIKTGKYTLQVGNYSRATNGLSLAMAQVVRETPTIMNSWSQFSMAISNNIPILMDNIQRYNTEHKEAIAILSQHKEAGLNMEQAMAAMGDRAKNLVPTWKAIAGSLLSLNTVVVGLTLAFQFITKAIDKKKKAQEEANKATKEAYNLQMVYNDVQRQTYKNASEELTRMKLLYAAAQNNNSAQKERLKAARELIKAQKEAFENFTAEDIVLGKASEAYANLAEKILSVAKAKAIEGKITEEQSKLLDINIDKQSKAMDVTIAKKKEALAKSSYDAALARFNEGVAAGKLGEELQNEANAVASADRKWKQSIKVREDAVAEWTKVDATAQDVENTIQSLTKTYIENGEFEERAARDAKDVQKWEQEKKDYYWAAQIAIAQTIADGYERRREITKVEAQRDIAELEEEGRKNIEQRDNINAIIAARYKKLFDDLAQITEEENEAIGKEIDKAYSEQNKAMFTARENRYNLEVAQAKSSIKNQKELFDTLKAMEIQYWKDVLEIALAQGNSDKIAEANAKIIEATSRVFTQKKPRSNMPKNLLETIFSFSDKFGAENAEEGGRMVLTQYQSLVSEVDKMLKASIGYMNEWIDTRIEMAQVAIDSAKAESDAAKSLMDAEIQARANGYASNVEYARREWEEKKKLEQEAIAEQKRLQKIQEAINTAQQVSSLITASAGLWAGSAPLGLAAPGWAIAATALMWSTFLASKAAALSLMNKETYGEGMSEYLDYGGSHASGNDIDFGVKKDGTRRRVERGEMVAVINKRNVRKYGTKNISDIISSLNHGSFDSQYGNAFEGLQMSGSGADLSTLEGDVRAIKEQGERKITYVNGKKVEVYKNTTRILS